jgi:hypothetical protein
MSAGQVGKQALGTDFKAHTVETGKTVLPCKEGRETVHADTEAACPLIAEKP